MYVISNGFCYIPGKGKPNKARNQIKILPNLFSENDNNQT